MERTIERGEDLNVKVAITLEPGEVQAAFDDLFNSWKNEVVLPGFRKGKAPRKLIEAHLEARIGKEAYAVNALERAVEKSLGTVLEEEKLQPYTSPHLHPHNLVEAYTPGEPFTYEAEFICRPELPEFIHEGILVQIPLREVSEEAIDISVDNYRRNLGTATPVEGRPAEPGDYALITVKAWNPEDDIETVDPQFTQTDTLPIGGPGSVPFLNDHLIGLQVGEEVMATEAVPVHDSDTGLPSNPVLKLKIKLDALETRDMPELTDALVAEKLGVYSTVMEFRNAIREQLMGHVNQARAEDLRRAVEGWLLKNVTFPMPQAAVEGRYKDIRDRTLYQYQQQGQDLAAEMEADASKKEALETQLWDAAEKSTRLDFIAEAVVERADLKVTEQEIWNYVNQMGRQANMEDADIKKLFQDRRFFFESAGRLARGKAWRFMLDHAEVEEVEIPEEFLGDGGTEAAAATHPLLEMVGQAMDEIEALTSDEEEEEEAEAEEKK